MKWFGCGVYSVAESVVIAAGRPVPSAGVVNQRREGVAIVLSGLAVKALSFYGLKKVYDSVLREAMWKVLRKLGDPDADSQPDKVLKTRIYLDATQSV